MRKLLIVCGLLVLGAACAKAQEGPGFEVSGNYQYVRFNPGNGASGINCHGGSGVFGAYPSGVSSKAANWGQIKTGQRKWPGTLRSFTRS